MMISSMLGLNILERRDNSLVDDDIVILHDVLWTDYERLLEVRGDKSVPRLTYLEGKLEIMSPSKDHEGIKSVVGRLVEAYCLDHDIRFSTVGSWTLKNKKAERGTEPDECYIFGDANKDRPDLVIENLWRSGRLDKLDVYRKLGITEIWYWREVHIQVYRLEGEHYVSKPRSVCLPDLDLETLIQFIDRPTTFDAIRDFRATY